MYHIVKTKLKPGFRLVAVGNNGEPLSSSEVFTTKEKCFVNAKAQLNSCFVSLADHLWPGVLVQDDTLPKPILWVVRPKGKKSKYIQSEVKPKYIPGRNPKKKSK